MGVSNVNAWILTITYALCFGVELTMTNVATLYFYEYHALRRANGDLKSQRDGLVDEVASLKKELAQTRLVLHGMEYYAAGHQHQTMAL